MSHRGTSNSNSRGGVEERRRRREWLVTTYRSDMDEVRIWDIQNGADLVAEPTWTKYSLEGDGLVRLQESWGRVAIALPTCRCYRCGALLTVETVTVDRIIPGCKGGTYRRNNIRPSCLACASHTGGKMGAERRKEKPSNQKNRRKK